MPVRKSPGVEGRSALPLGEGRGGTAPSHRVKQEVQGGAPAKALALDQNRLGDIRRGFGVPGVKICPDLFGVLLG